MPDLRIVPDSTNRAPDWGTTRTSENLSSVYLFTCDDQGTPGNTADDTWNQTAKFAASQQQAGENLVSDLNFVDDTLIFGQANHPANGTDRGGVFVFANRPATDTVVRVVNDGPDDWFEYDSTGLPVNQGALPAGNNSPRGTTSLDGVEQSWTMDNDDFVYVSEAGQSVGKWQATGLSRPEGIATDGVDIWIADRGTDRVYRFSQGAQRLSGSAASSSDFRLASGNRNPRGVAYRDQKLWVVNSSRSDRIYVYHLDGSLAGSWLLDPQNTTPEGVAVAADGDIWVVDRSKDEVFVYENASTRRSGSQTATRTFPQFPSNGNARGISLR